MQLSANDLAIARTPGQSTELYLSIFSPSVVLACLVSGTVSTNSRSIPYTSVSSGDYNDIESGMTMLIGTSAGSSDLGKIRVKSATATHIEVAENSHINWPPATHLTVLKYWELWPIYPRIINDPNNVDDVIFYKDYDVAYTNQNSVLGAFPCAGTHRAGFVGDSFYYSATGTTHLLGSALSYDWSIEVEPGVTNGSSSATPGWVQYDTPGHFVTRLEVTGANGSVDVTYRYVSIYERPTNSSQNNPIKKWEMSSLSGSRGEGGYSTSITITDEILSNIRDGDVVVIWSDDWYGSNHVSLGGNSPNNSSTFFVGHIVNGSIRYNYQTSKTEFEVASVTDIMKVTEGFSVSVESKANPTKWFEMLDMDGRRALYHFLKWHTTALLFNDFEFRGTDRKIQYFDSDRESIFDAVDNYMRGTLLGSFVADRQGKLWAEVGAPAYSNPPGSFIPIQEVTKSDWMGEPTIQQRLTVPLSFIELGGVAYSGTTTGTFSALIACAPGQTPNIRGSVERTQGLALESQTQLNLLAGNVYANKTTKYPLINMNMSRNFNNLDIAPQETVDMNILSTDTNMGIAIHAPYLVDSVSWSFDALNKIKLPTVEFSALVNGRTGETITIPDVPEGGGYSDQFGGFGGFKAGAFPPFLSTVGSASYWRGYATSAGVASGATTDPFGGFTAIEGDTSLVSSVSDGAVINVSGLYLYQASTAMATSVASMINYVRVTLDTADLYEDAYVFPNQDLDGAGYSIATIGVDKMHLAYLPAGHKIQVNAGWGGSGTNRSIGLRLTVIKVG